MYTDRIKQLQTWLASQSADIAYISEPQHIAYFTGYLSEPHERVLALFVSANQPPFLFTPALEVTDAQNSGWPYDVVGYLDNQKPYELIKKEIQQRFKAPAIFALEKDNLTVQRFEALQAAFPDAKFSVDITPFMQKLLLIKSETEIQQLLAAGDWADVAFEVGFKAIKAGATEEEIIAEIHYHLQRNGVSSMSFDTLVLAGENAASPHGTPGKTAVKQNELVLFDLGVIWQGYCSDATRTVAFHEPTAFQKEIYETVLEAQLAAQAAVKPGITAAQLDKIARDVITNRGYGEYFNHRLGHGIGTTVHEYPSIVEGNDLVLEEGMCFSIEPGIYIPDKVGVRIEDCVAVTKDGCIPFTKTPKDLLIIQ
ncbi:MULTISPECIES: Xaa-Pro peptidase family protein [unclassified Enterococcus]|uniref:M24 family metallopeptidase n=1 Tax=unclassified Enterococcus TaxID=2608891 RepID=UPI002472E856|nr:MULTISPECIES: Xaa-Pro peptidase family protein [unclassified Enterococcus]